MKIVVPNGPLENMVLCDWAARVIGQEPFERAQALGWMDHTGLRAVVVLHDHSPPNVMLSWASTTEKWMTRSVLKIIHDWIFVQLQCGRVTGLVEKPNKRARKLNERLGMRLEGVIRKASTRGKDIFVFGMLREEGEALMRRLKI